jgi:hypothetical protein
LVLILNSKGCHINITIIKSLAKYDCKGNFTWQCEASKSNHVNPHILYVKCLMLSLYYVQKHDLGKSGKIMNLNM